MMVPPALQELLPKPAPRNHVCPHEVTVVSRCILLVGKRRIPVSARRSAHRVPRGTGSSAVPTAGLRNVPETARVSYRVLLGRRLERLETSRFLIFPPVCSLAGSVRARREARFAGGLLRRFLPSGAGGQAGKCCFFFFSRNLRSRVTLLEELFLHYAAYICVGTYCGVIAGLKRIQFC